MKARALVYFGISWVAFLGSAFNNTQFVIAKPAPLFQPILQDIRTQLPKDLVMRLPAFVPSSPGIHTYAVVRQQVLKNYFIVRLVSSSDCDATACSVGAIIVTRRNPLEPPYDGISDSRRQAKPINLKPGIKGFFSMLTVVLLVIDTMFFGNKTGYFLRLNLETYLKKKL